MKIEDKKKRLIDEINSLEEKMYDEYANGNKNAFNIYRPLIKAKRFNLALLSPIKTEDDVSSALCLFDGDDVWELFKLICERNTLSPKVFAYALKWAWTDSYPGPEVLPYFQKVDGKLMMDNDELEYFNGLPDTVELYRGCDKEEMNTADGNDFGISWTTSREVAEFFAFRHKKEGRIVVQTKVPKEYILTFINEREEFECIVLLVPSLAVSVITDKPTEYFDKYMKERENQN